MIEGQPLAPIWLLGLRVYLAVIVVGNLAWETLQLLLYTIWMTGTLEEQVFAVIHCTLGDLLIALSSLMLALVIAGNHAWPRGRFWSVATLALMFGVAYTTFSEWLNIVVRQSWAYSERMPLIPLLGFRIGLSPLLQWVVVPAAAFGLVRWMTFKHSDGGRR